MKNIVFASLLALGLAAGPLACTETDSLVRCVDETPAEVSEVDALVACLSIGLAFDDQAQCEAYVEEHGGFADSRAAACMKLLAPPSM